MSFVINCILLCLLVAWATYQNLNSVYFAYEYTPETFKNAIDFSAYTFVAEIAISPMVYAFLLMLFVLNNTISKSSIVFKSRKRTWFTSTIAMIVLFFIITHGILFATFLQFEQFKNWQVKRLEVLHNAYKGIVLTRLALAVVILALGIMALKPKP